ncbi:MAG TPA: DUF4339 domain-containing protein, partial [Chthoniobacterales bacterium]|nr:DUF4339 domain-containing protein [Chthoniobacterales bacterium]
MQIYVGKGGQQLGPFSLEEVNRKLADGTFAGTDLAWYEGAAGWAPLSGVPGVVVAPAAAATPAPAPAPLPVPAPVSSPVAPLPSRVRPNASIVQPPRSGTRTLAVVSWVLLGITFLVSLIPFLGCGTWFMVWPVAIACIIMGIICLTRGATAKGMFIILGAILIVPLCIFGQFMSLAVFGGTVERTQQTQIMENLRRIDTAKAKFVTETKASNGTPVTMVNLTSQLGGKEVKPVVEETYDPMPVGQAPTATLPANKTLGTFSGGDVLTIASLEKSVAEGSTLSWIKRSRTTTSSPTAAPSFSPKPSLAPSVTASPNPSLTPPPPPSPKSSAAPHSLISPRQSVEPDNSPSSRQSPSGKFAPRNGPRQSTSPSQDQPNSEK